MAKSKQKKISSQQIAKKKQLAASKKLARRIEFWHKRLAAKFPDIDAHDLDLIIASLLKTPQERTEVMFLKRREDGLYVF